VRPTLRRIVLFALCTAVPLGTTTVAEAATAPAKPRKPRPAPKRGPKALPDVAPPQPPSPPGFSFSFGRGRLGVQVTSMTPELRAFFGAKQSAGILVQRVEPGSPAEAAGIAVGDVVVEVDGEPVADVGDVARAIADRGTGDAVDVVVVRNKTRKTLRPKLQDDAHELSTGDLRLHRFPEGFPFEHGDLDGMREQLDEIRERLDALERSRTRAPKKKTAPKAPPKSST